MEIICQGCESTLNIQDTKIPQGQKLSLTCPKCKKKIILEPRKDASQHEEDPKTSNSQEIAFAEEGSKDTPSSGNRSYSYDEYSADLDLHFLEEGTKLALILPADRDEEGKIKASLEEIGYRTVSSPNTRDATGKMRFHRFDTIVLCDGYDNQPLDQSPILGYLNRLTMSVRRQIFLTLVGDQFKSMDNMMAFAMSANLVVCRRDIDQMPLIMNKAISENDRFYKVFTDTLAEVGKI
jgi:hypothetical protein